MTASESNFLIDVNDPLRLSNKLRNLLAGNPGTYYLCLGGTETSDIPSISAAGATPAQRRLTPSLDADVLQNGCARQGETIPVSPTGIVSPVVIARACLQSLRQKPVVIDCGTFRQPLAPDVVSGNMPAKSLQTGKAMDLAIVQELFDKGLKFGQNINTVSYALIAECVPGGTTTAAAVLQALGIRSSNLVSTSVLSPDKISRAELIDAGIRNSGHTFEHFLAEPLRAIASVGDPMQAFTSGMVLSALQRMPVILGGGSQMLAVYSLVVNISQSHKISVDLSNLFVLTTKWVVSDPAGNTKLLSQLLGANFFASNPNFLLSQHAGLRAYEQYNVKEGVGAGALMAACQAHNTFDDRQLMESIDAAYSELNLQPTF